MVMMLVRSAFCFLILLISMTVAVAQPSRSRFIRFEGVPPTTVVQIKKRFPSISENKVTLSEVDQIIRWMMSTKTFANVEVIERTTAGIRETVVLASLLRRITDIEVTGNKRFNEAEVAQALEVIKGQTFERKDLVASTDKLLDDYQNAAYYNARIEIDFTLPTPSDVSVHVSINEGTPCRVVEVNFETANKILAERAKKIAKSYLLNKICSEENRLGFQKTITEFFGENRYLTARLSSPATTFNSEKTQAKMTYLIENAYRYEFLFEGNDFFEEGTIIRQIGLDKLFGLTTSPAVDLADRIRRVYQANGFANVEVTHQERVFEELQRYQIKYQIKEGQRIRIRKIQVAGNISRPEKYYAQFITDNSSPLISRGYYSRKDFEVGYKNLITELQNHGFLKARIQSVRTENDKDGSGVTIFIGLEEGPMTHVRQIKFEGATAIPKNELLDVLTVKNNAPLSLKELESSIARLKSFYHSRGHLEMKLLNEGIFEGDDAIIDYNDTNTQASLTFQIQEGPRVKVASINVVGNTFTKDYVVLRELEFKAGETLTPEKLDESRFRLQKLGLFSSVKIESPEDGTNIADRNVQVQIQERDPGLVLTGIGVTNERQITGRGYLGVTYRNLRGTGRAVSSRVSLQYSSDPKVSFLENKITFGYLEPYIFGGRNRGRLNLTREQVYFGEETDTKRAIIQESNDIDLLLERDLTRHLKLTYTAWGFSNIRQFYRGQMNKTIETQNIAKTGPLFEYDLRDNPFVTTRGSYTSLGLEYADPVLGSSNDVAKPFNSQRLREIIQYSKVTAGTKHYLRILGSPRFIWASEFRGGYLANMSPHSGSGVPPAAQFFLGSRSTIRGFDTREVERIPNNTQLGVNNLGLFRMTNDSHFYLVKTELRFPLFGQVDGALFYDGGAVLISQRGVEIDDPYRDSAGIALRYNTPVGAVNIELGFKLDRKKGGNAGPESAHALHFSLGTF